MANGPWFRAQNKTWYVQVAGQQRNLGKDKAEAFRCWHKLKGQQPESTPRGNHRVREVLDDYWGWLKANRAEETCNGRKSVLKSFGEFVPARMRIMDLQPLHVQKWLDKTYPACRSTRRNTLITWIKTACNWAVQMGYASANPIAMMEKPTPEVRQEFVPADQWPKLIAACTDQAFRDYVVMILAAGARPQEMRKFEAQHFDGSRLILPIVSSKGKKRSRVVYLPPEPLAIVQRLVTEYPDGKLFRNRRGTPWDKNSIRCRFRRLKRIMEMPKLCATTLRHSYCHHRLTSKQDSLTVAKLMGHVDTRMVATRYGHLEDTEYLAGEAKRISFPLLDAGDANTLPGAPVES